MFVCADVYSLRTLYRRCDKEPFILVLKTDRGCVSACPLWDVVYCSHVVSLLVVVSIGTGRFTSVGISRGIW